MRILILAIRAMGDVVLITPIIRLIRQNLSPFYLAILVDSISAEVLLNNPYIDKLYVINRTEHRKKPIFQRIGRDIEFIKELRRESFDITIDLFSGPRSAILSYLSGADVRYGEDKRAKLRGFLYNKRVKVKEEGHHLIEQKLQIINSLIQKAEDTALGLFLTENEINGAKRLLVEKGGGDGSLRVGLFPGSGWHHKNWPPEKFANLGDSLADKYNAEILIFGGTRDVAVCKQVEGLMLNPSINLYGVASVRDTIALINEVDLFVSNDTGPMHIAVALKKPTVALFGPSDVKKYGPWGKNAVVVSKYLPCSPCPQQVDTCKDNQCMKLIEVGDVLESIKTFIKDEDAG
ncbi:MAG: glycosyltransferase family 9 protein [Planctomycetota bacterium]|nr:glycosyltransferase family 9 protein [Planctomycetota bacterium]MDE1890238.1 glycosyltransferase family 9 protein [Planctomycetota bacterium]MDE2217366.1 glycosyltransferase family 9 protein [Planctomycetota bacterium]